MTDYTTSNTKDIIKANALVKLGILYSEGILVKKNLTKAADFYRHAVNLGSNLARSKLVSTLWWIPSDASNTEMINLATYGSEKGDAICSYWLGRSYVEARGVKKDLPMACNYLHKSVEQGNISCLGELLDTLWRCNTIGASDNLKKLAKHYAKVNNPDAQLRLARMYAIGKEFDKNIHTSNEYYSNAISNGITWIGEEYFQSLTKEYGTYDIPIEELQKCANANSPSGLSLLGSYYAKNINTIYQAIDCYQRAYQLGKAEVAEQLIDLFWKIRSPDALSAMNRLAFTEAKNNNSACLGRLGRMYLSGTGVEHNIKKSIEYFMNASSENLYWLKEYATALFLDASYESGCELRRILPLIEISDPDFKNILLGNMYREGVGVKQSYAEMELNYKKSTTYPIISNNPEYIFGCYQKNQNNFAQINSTAPHYNLANYLQSFYPELFPLYFLIVIPSEIHRKRVYQLTIPEPTFDNICNKCLKAYYVLLNLENKSLIKEFQYFTSVSINYILNVALECNHISEEGRRSIFKQFGKPSVQKKIQAQLLKLLKEFDKFCTSYDIPYWISEGSLLGAIRHDGFVPWDDDIDVCMVRKDLERLQDLIKKSKKIKILSIKWVISDTDSIHSDRIFFINDNEYFIDIFTMDYCGENTFATWATHQSIRNEYVSEVIKRGDNSNIEYDLEKKYTCIIHKKLDPNNTKKYLIWSITNANYWKKRVYATSDIFPLSRILFEGYPIMAPKKATDYVKENYGNFWMFPNDALSHKHHQL